MMVLGRPGTLILLQRHPDLLQRLRKGAVVSETPLLLLEGDRCIALFFSGGKATVRSSLDTPVRKAARKRSRTNALPTLSVQRFPTFDDPEQRAAMTAEAAYFLAERRGFAPGHELDDWLVAEDQIRAQLALGIAAEQVQR